MNGGVGGQTQSTLYLGSGANEIHATTITIGEAQDLDADGSGTMKWNSGVTTGTLLLAGTGSTTAVTNMYVGAKTDTGSTYDHTGTADFTNGTITGSITNLYVGYQTSNGGSSNPQTFGTFKIGSSSASALTIGALYLGYQSATDTARTTTGSFEISGGNVSVTNHIEMTRSTGGIASLSVLGGTLSVGGNITSLGGTETLTLDGGTLDLTGGAIGDATNAISTITFASGTLRNVASINGSGGLTKTSTGTLTLEGNHSFTGATTVSSGTLILNGSLTSDISVGAAKLAPRGLASTTGSVNLPAGSTLRVQLTGATVGTQYDQLSVGGTVTLGGTLELVVGASLAPGSAFTILNKAGTTTTSTTFSGLAENSIFSSGGYSFRINYNAGTGNDVVLTLITTPIEQWRYANFGSIFNTGAGLDTADGDGDRVVNLIEYATKMNPASNDKLPATATKAGATIEFIYTKNKAATDVTISVEWSDNLTTWSSAGVTTSVLTDGATTQQIKAVVPAAVAKRFVRLKVTRP
jgi:autotransporter-associated beta strand protein